MTTSYIRFLFYFAVYFISTQLGYENMWWLLIGIAVGETLISSWRRRQRVNSLTPEQSIGSLTALLRIRSSEIGAMYYSLRNYQKEAKDTSWIPLFLAEYRSGCSYNIYEDPCDKKEKKYRDRAHAIYKKRFESSHNPFFGTLDEPELIDIGVAMLCWTSGIDGTIRLLNSIHCDTNLSRHVCALLREYRFIQFLTLNGNYHILFKNWWLISPLIRDRYSLLRQHWEEIVRSHQCSILINRATNNLHESPLVSDNIWEENKVLGEMEMNMRRALSQKNSNSHGWDRDWKNEAGFFLHLKSNPIWTKLYGYEPYTTLDSNQTN